MNKKCTQAISLKMKAFTSKPRKVKLFMLMIMLQLLSIVAYSQSLRVTGTITDSKGEPLPGVTVKVQGETTGVSTSISGQYSIDVPNSKAVLTFIYIGFETKQEVVGTRSTINITLGETMSNLEEVIVVGYGTQKKRDVTGAISSISAKVIEEKQPVSIFDAIQGAAPGVRVMNSSGAPGEEGDITIRGLSTLSDEGVKPLYIVDGVTMNSINAINPKDIQSIEILKDAASAAIYGSRSANGVILVTTKRGEEGKPRINVDYLRSYSNLSKRVPQSNRLERSMWDRRNASGLDPKPDDSTSFARNADNDYQALITQTALRNQIDLGMSGGTKQLKYFNSLQYLDEEGILITSYNKRLTMRTNVQYDPSSKVSLSTRLNFSYRDRNNINEGNMLRQALQRPPGMALYFPDGTYIYNNGGRRNPLAEAYLRENISNTYQGVLYQAIDFKILTPLTFHADASADVALQRTKTFNSKLLDTNNPQASSGGDNTELPIRTIGNAYFNYKQTFNSDHNLTAMAGINLEKNNSDEVNIQGRFFVTEAVHTLNAAGELSLSDVYSNGSGSSLVGFYGRLGYDYKGRYLLNATLRRDGSSVFGRDNRWGNFPSLSLGWRFSDESFMKWSKNILTDAKIRGSWGITGNQAIGPYDAVQQFVFGSYFYNGVSGIRTNDRLGNSLLKWEETTQSNLGVDLTFLNGRISFIADAYVKNTKDLLYDAPLPLEAGFPGRARTNAGGLRNRGLELMLTGFPVRNTNFSWQTSVNWSQVRNKITSLPGGDYIANNIWYVGEGKEAGNFYGYKYLGVYEYDQSNAYTEDYRTRLIPQFQKDELGNVVIEKTKQPNLIGYTYPDGTPYTGPEPKKITAGGVVSAGGDVIWENLPDASGNINGSIGNEDRQILGHGQPRWSLGWTNNFNYKKFTLSFNLYGNFGGSIYNENRRNLASFNNSNTTPEPNFIHTFWKYPGMITDAYRGGDRTADNMRRGGSYFLEDGSFIRLQSLRFGYQLPQSIGKKMFMQNLNLYAYGTNLLTWTKYTGFDPEVAQQSVLTPGDDPGRYPRRREMGLGLNITF